ncbi:type II toxin-antitoxin system VapC family toxin [Candidatus Thiosymbion oneisti]|uniref:type II toxin-antitoxin system VapC family toxin n=1 Tax=Candidatus Thiosymbion oneisti TaxID=589554 RepID=UPI001061BE88|nr:type II toxin-antitoxin system VapC family toxin [Candidatus Thiosymbion oneisti]
MLLDSNIIIYSFPPEFRNIQAVVSKRDTWCSAISYVETLGYHKLSEDEKHYLQRLFDTISVLPITQAIISTAVEIRQQRKMSLGDAIVAATALEHRQTLVTRNIKDFDNVEGLKVIDPLA